MILGITTDCFHYKVYKWMHKIWQIELPRSSHYSLCRYSQFLFWMTMLTMIASPIMFIGWSILKITRLIYKVLSWTKPGRAVIDFLDKNFELSETIETSSRNMLDHAAISLIMTTLSCFSVLAVTALILGICSGGIYLFICLFMNLPEYIVGFLQCLALGMFHFFAIIGLHFTLAGGWIFFALNYVWVLVTIYAISIAFVIALVLVSSLFLLLLVKLAMCFESVSNFFGFKVNGFQKAMTESQKRREKMERERADKRRERMKKLDEIADKKLSGEIPYTTTEKFVKFTGKKICSFGQWLENKMISKTKKVKGGSVKVMTGLGIVWETLMSIKNGVCPFIEFVDSEDIEEE